MIKATPQRGFTLLEVLVAVTLLALFATVLSKALQFGLVAAGRIDAGARQMEDSRNARAFLRARIAEARPIWNTDLPTSHVAFAGSTERLEFETERPQSDGRAGLARYVISVAQGGGRFRLLCIVVGDDQKDAPRREPSVLLTGDGSLSFSYFGPAFSGGDPVWQQDWTSRRHLPLLVAIRRAAGNMTWPELIVRPRLDVVIDCRIDLESLACQ